MDDDGLVSLAGIRMVWRRESVATASTCSSSTLSSFSRRSTLSVALDAAETPVLEPPVVHDPLVALMTGYLHLRASVLAKLQEQSSAEPPKKLVKRLAMQTQAVEASLANAPLPEGSRLFSKLRSSPLQCLYMHVCTRTGEGTGDDRDAPRGSTTAVNTVRVRRFLLQNVTPSPDNNKSSSKAVSCFLVLGAQGSLVDMLYAVWGLLSMGAPFDDVMLTVKGETLQALHAWQAATHSKRGDAPHDVYHQSYAYVMELQRPSVQLPPAAVVKTPVPLLNVLVFVVSLLNAWCEDTDIDEEWAEGYNATLCSPSTVILLVHLSNHILQKLIVPRNMPSVSRQTTHCYLLHTMLRMLTVALDRAFHSDLPEADLGCDATPVIPSPPSPPIPSPQGTVQLRSVVADDVSRFASEAYKVTSHPSIPLPRRLVSALQHDLVHLQCVSFPYAFRGAALQARLHASLTPILPSSPPPLLCSVSAALCVVTIVVSPHRATRRSAGGSPPPFTSHHTFAESVFRYILSTPYLARLLVSVTAESPPPSSPVVPPGFAVVCMAMLEAADTNSRTSELDDARSTHETATPKTLAMPCLNFLIMFIGSPSSPPYLIPLLDVCYAALQRCLKRSLHPVMLLNALSSLLTAIASPPQSTKYPLDSDVEDRMLQLLTLFSRSKTHQLGPPRTPSITPCFTWEPFLSPCETCFVTLASSPVPAVKRTLEGNPSGCTASVVSIHLDSPLNLTHPITIHSDGGQVKVIPPPFRPAATVVVPGAAPTVYIPCTDTTNLRGIMVSWGGLQSRGDSLPDALLLSSWLLGRCAVRGLLPPTEPHPCVTNLESNPLLYHGMENGGPPYHMHPTPERDAFLKELVSDPSHPLHLAMCRRLRGMLSMAVDPGKASQVVRTVAAAIVKHAGEAVLDRVSGGDDTLAVAAWRRCSEVLVWATERKQAWLLPSSEEVLEALEARAALLLHVSGIPMSEGGEAALHIEDICSDHSDTGNIDAGEEEEDDARSYAHFDSLQSAGHNVVKFVLQHIPLPEQPQVEVEDAPVPDEVLQGIAAARDEVRAITEHFELRRERAEVVLATLRSIKDLCRVYMGVSDEGAFCPSPSSPNEWGSSPSQTRGEVQWEYPFALFISLLSGGRDGAGRGHPLMHLEGIPPHLAFDLSEAMRMLSVAFLSHLHDINNDSLLAKGTVSIILASARWVSSLRFLPSDVEWLHETDVIRRLLPILRHNDVPFMPLREVFQSTVPALVSYCTTWRSHAHRVPAMYRTGRSRIDHVVKTALWDMAKELEAMLAMLKKKCPRTEQAAACHTEVFLQLEREREWYQAARHVLPSNALLASLVECTGTRSSVQARAGELCCMRLRNLARANSPGDCHVSSMVKSLLRMAGGCEAGLFLHCEDDDEGGAVRVTMCPPALQLLIISTFTDLLRGDGPLPTLIAEEVWCAVAGLDKWLNGIISLLSVESLPQRTPPGTPPSSPLQEGEERRKMSLWSIEPSDIMSSTANPSASDLVKGAEEGLAALVLLCGRDTPYCPGDAVEVWCGLPEHVECCGEEGVLATGTSPHKVVGQWLPAVCAGVNAVHGTVHVRLDPPLGKLGFDVTEDLTFPYPPQCVRFAGDASSLCYLARYAHTWHVNSLTDSISKFSSKKELLVSSKAAHPLMPLILFTSVKIMRTISRLMRIPATASMCTAACNRPAVLGGLLTLATHTTSLRTFKGCSDRLGTTSFVLSKCTKCTVGSVDMPQPIYLCHTCKGKAKQVKNQHQQPMMLCAFCVSFHLGHDIEEDKSGPRAQQCESTSRTTPSSVTLPWKPDDLAFPVATSRLVVSQLLSLLACSRQLPDVPKPPPVSPPDHTFKCLRELVAAGYDESQCLSLLQQTGDAAQVLKALGVARATAAQVPPTPTAKSPQLRRGALPFPSIEDQGQDEAEEVLSDDEWVEVLAHRCKLPVALLSLGLKVTAVASRAVTWAENSQRTFPKGVPPVLEAWASAPLTYLSKGTANQHPFFTFAKCLGLKLLANNESHAQYTPSELQDLTALLGRVVVVSSPGCIPTFGIATGEVTEHGVGVVIPLGTLGPHHAIRTMVPPPSLYHPVNGVSGFMPSETGNISFLPSALHGSLVDLAAVVARSITERLLLALDDEGSALTRPQRPGGGKMGMQETADLLHQTLRRMYAPYTHHEKLALPPSLRDLARAVARIKIAGMSVSKLLLPSVLGNLVSQRTGDQIHVVTVSTTNPAKKTTAQGEIHLWGARSIHLFILCSDPSNMVFEVTSDPASKSWVKVAATPQCNAQTCVFPVPRIFYRVKLRAEREAPHYGVNQVTIYSQPDVQVFDEGFAAVRPDPGYALSLLGEIVDCVDAQALKDLREGRDEGISSSHLFAVWSACTANLSQPFAPFRSETCNILTALLPKIVAIGTPPPSVLADLQKLRLDLETWRGACLRDGCNALADFLAVARKFVVHDLCRSVLDSIDRCIGVDTTWKFGFVFKFGDQRLCASCATARMLCHTPPPEPPVPETSTAYPLVCDAVEALEYSWVTPSHITDCFDSVVCDEPSPTTGEYFHGVRTYEGGGMEIIGTEYDGATLMPFSKTWRVNPAVFWAAGTWVDRMASTRFLAEYLSQRTMFIPPWLVHEVGYEGIKSVTVLESSHPYTTVCHSGSVHIKDTIALRVSFGFNSCIDRSDELVLSAKHIGGDDLGRYTGKLSMALPFFDVPHHTIYYQFRVRERIDHPGILCQACSLPVVGIRYHCTVCCDSFCQTCVEGDSFAHNPIHLLLRLRRPIKFIPATLPVMYPPAYTTTEAFSSTVHSMRCSNCNANIEGIRYWCENCHWYNLCGKCVERDYEVHNKYHVFLRVVHPLPTTLRENPLPYGPLYEKGEDWGYFISVSAPFTAAFPTKEKELSATKNIHSSFQNAWSREMGEYIVTQVDEDEERYWNTIEGESLHRWYIHMSPTYELENVMKSRMLSRLRFILLKLYNYRVAAFEDDPSDGWTGTNIISNKWPVIVQGTFGKPARATTMGDLLLENKAFVFQQVLQTIWHHSLETNTADKQIPVVLQRMKDKEGYQDTVFVQMYQQLRFRVFSRNGPQWHVTFVGEASSDYGGPFCESLTEIAQELQTDALPLFVPVPNSVAEVGGNRDQWVCNPSISSDSHFAMLHFVGRVMGSCLRSGNVLALNLPTLLWKVIVCEPVTLDDIKAIDGLLLQHPEECTPDMDFTTHSMDRRVVPLLGTASEGEKVDEGREAQYLSLLHNFKLSEILPHALAIRQGLVSVIPETALTLSSWSSLRDRVCGDEDVNVTALQALAVYKGYKPTSNEIRDLWEVLWEFTPKQRSLFLRFVSGRSRLSVNPPPMKICKVSVSNDDKMPTSQTCFFTLMLPTYTSK
eukprot:Sspe_Gene.47993::Locus_24726_Transcript_1_1_Confidence_1.000_Length_10189::g.47993::m.47993